MRDRQHSCGHAAAGLCRARAPLPTRRGARRIAGHAVLRSGAVSGAAAVAELCVTRAAFRRNGRAPTGLPSGCARAGAGPSLGLLLGASAWDEEAATATAEEDWVQDRADPRVLTNGAPTVYPVRSTTGTTARARPVGLARPAGRDLLGGEERCELHAHSRRPGLRWDAPPTTMPAPTHTVRVPHGHSVRHRSLRRTATPRPPHSMR